MPGGEPDWRKASSFISDFNGLRESFIRGGLEVGVFAEKHGARWGVRVRPVDAVGEALDSWGHRVGFDTKREAVAFATRAYWPPASGGVT